MHPAFFKPFRVIDTAELLRLRSARQRAFAQRAPEEPIPLWWTSDFINSSPEGTEAKDLNASSFVGGLRDH